MTWLVYGETILKTFMIWLLLFTEYYQKMYTLHQINNNLNKCFILCAKMIVGDINI